MKKEELESLIKSRFAGMPPKIRVAARYVLDSPKEVALQSMRSVAAAAGLHPASMLRLAREVGFENYEAFKSVYVEWMTRQDWGLVSRTRELRNRTRHEGAEKSLANFVQNEVVNLERALHLENEASWIKAQKVIARAPNVYVLGMRSLFSAAYYFHYVLSSFRPGVTLVYGTGGTGADEIRRIEKRDVLVCFTSTPYTVVSVQAANFAADRGATLVAISDSMVSPVASRASITILAPNSNLSAFPSVISHLAVAQTLAQLLISGGGEETLAEASNSEEQLKQFGVYAPR